MRYFYKRSESYQLSNSEIHVCNHPVYNFCTLYKCNEKGLAVIQQRYDPITKHTWWGAVDPWLSEDIYSNEHFQEYFDKKSDTAKNNIYPTVTVRQIMWALRMKPLKKEKWETVFDRKDI